MGHSQYQQRVKTMKISETDEVVLTLMALIFNTHLNEHPFASKTTDDSLVHHRDQFQAMGKTKAALLIEAIRCRTTAPDPGSAPMNFLPTGEDVSG
jgi:hypothetical protein